MDVCCVMSGRCLCDELIIRPEESYRLWYVVACDLETSRMRRPLPTGGCRAKKKIQTGPEAPQPPIQYEEYQVSLPKVKRLEHGPGHSLLF